MNETSKSVCTALILLFLTLPASLLNSTSAQDSPTVSASGFGISAPQSTIVKLFGAGVGTLDSYGTGVLVSEEGHVVTVWNHLVNTGYLTAVVSDGRRFNVEVVGTSLQHDLAVLKLDAIDTDTFSFVPLDSTAEAVTGQSVLAFSNVYHVATGNEPVSVVHGVIACSAPLKAGLGQWEFPVAQPVYVLDAITNNSGAAGGLVTNLAGEPIGLLGREIRHRETNMWVNYAVPWISLQPAIRTVLSGERVTQVDTTNDDTRISERRLTASYGITLIPGVLERTPAFVDRVVPGSIAAAAGFQRGDLIVLVQDTVIKSVRDLQKCLAAIRPRRKISITVDRDGRLETLSLRTPR